MSGQMNKKLKFSYKKVLMILVLIKNMKTYSFVMFLILFSIFQVHLIAAWSPSEVMQAYAPF